MRWWQLRWRLRRQRRVGREMRRLERVLALLTNAPKCGLQLSASCVCFLELLPLLRVGGQQCVVLRLQLGELLDELAHRVSSISRFLDALHCHDDGGFPCGKSWPRNRSRTIVRALQLWLAPAHSRELPQSFFHSPFFPRLEPRLGCVMWSTMRSAEHAAEWPESPPRLQSAPARCSCLLYTSPSPRDS